MVIGGALGTPVTYMLDGRQHIALTVGGTVPELRVHAAVMSAPEGMPRGSGQGRLKQFGRT
jgi:hypothetical protein